jgi:alpha-glucosidase
MVFATAGLMATLPAMALGQGAGGGAGGGAGDGAAQTPQTTRVAEQLSGRAVRYFASPAAREAAHPSYALVEEPAARGALPPAGPAGTVAPIFTKVDGREAVIVRIEAGTSLYGTGEAAGPLLRNGRSIIAWNTDAYGYGDEAPSLYKAHPWVLAVRADGTAFGVLADTTYRCTIDTAATRADEIRFVADGPSFPVIVIEGGTPQEVVQELGRLTGLIAMPPKWALGYHQCRYSYFPESRVREIARNFRERDIPCDVLWYDIDYMEGFRVFTFNREHFPDPKKLNADLLGDGFHNVWMINPGIKSREEPSPNDPPNAGANDSPEMKALREAERNRFRAVRDSGKAQGMYVTRADGTVYEGEVWPGWCFFPDYTRPEVRTWWGPWYQDFMAMGITGVWNDMNEPAIFNVPSKTMPEDNVHLGDPGLIKPNGQAQGAEAAKGTHARYHNVYGMLMIKGTREGIMATNPDKRPFVLSRASYIGGQRYGASWSGDNSANWYHLETSISMVLNMGMSGQPFYGPDIGGFAGNGDGRLFQRWISFGAFFPFSRGHTGKDAIDKEPWAFGPEVEETSRLALQRRYRLMPHFYTLFHEASVNGMPVMRPTFFADPTDPALRSEDDSFLLGDGLLVVAKCVPDSSRVVVMPKGIWRQFDFEVPTGTRNTTKGRDGQDPELPTLHLRGGTIIPTGPVVEFVGEKPLDPLTLIVSLDAEGKASGTLYEDAGEGFAYREGEFLLTRYEATRVGTTVTVKATTVDGKMARPARGVVVRVLLDNGREAVGRGTDGGEIRVDLPGV